jgi:2,3-bisphosphoglycerate-independent phosphoglycerate mutase
MNLKCISSLVKTGDKIILLVMDGLGGLPIDGRTELETAKTPQMDLLASEGICGLHEPVGTGITPGSGPSHLALFGYEPMKYEVGRGVLSALGINFDLMPEDIAARGNFCTIDESGRVTDRRAGRISTELNRRLCQKLREIKIPSCRIFAETEKEHRFVLVIRGSGLTDGVTDTDPQETGLPPLPPGGRSPADEHTAEIVRMFLEQAKEILKDEHPANMILLRGFARRPNWRSFHDSFGVRAAAIAGYPMYRGLARLLGMQILQTEPDLDAEWTTLEKNWDRFDFFYLHVKDTDSSGEDGDFERKVRVIETVDAMIPRLRRLKPGVLMITGDHSTPAILKGHSWHPVPVLLWSPACRADNVTSFGERACMNGGLGPQIPAVRLMPLALAHAGRLKKFGA